MNYTNFVFKLEEIVSGGKGEGVKIIRNIFIKNKKASVIFKAVIDAIADNKKEFIHLDATHKIPSSVRNAVRHIYSFDMNTIKIMAGRRKGKYDYNDDKFKSIVNDLMTINNLINNIKSIKKIKEPLISYRDALSVWNQINNPNMYCTPKKDSDDWKEVQALRIMKKYAN